VTRERVTELGRVLAGDARGRTSAEDVTLFDSTGLAIQDLAICHALLAAHRAGRVETRTVKL
jgi:alanine dehydrogenase